MMIRYGDMIVLFLQKRRYIILIVIVRIELFFLLV